VAKIYELPDDAAQLSDDELKAHISAAAVLLDNDDLEANIQAAVKTFKSASSTTTVTASTLPHLRKLKAVIDVMKGEADERLTAASAAAAEIDALTAEVFGETDATASADGEADTDGETDATASADGEADTKVVEPSAVTKGEEVTASATRRQSLDLSAVRAKSGGTLSRYTAPEPASEIEIMAAVDVPGFRPGQPFELDDITTGVMRRATGLKTAGGGTGLVASYRLPFSRDMVIDDSSAIPEGTKALSVAVDQRRLKGGDLVAAGGWCAPSETLYDIVDIACPDMLFDVPEVQLNRGGLRFFRPPALDINALTFVWTEAMDQAASSGAPTKPCFQIPCAQPIDVRCDAIGVCLEAGILTQRFFPEMIDWYVRNSVVAHEIRLKAEAYNKARAASVPVTTTASFAAFSAVYAAVALQAADMIERYNLCDTISLEVVFPWWARNMFLADIARQRGVDVCDLNANCIEGAFAGLGVRVQWARGLAPDVPTNIGGATPAAAWPADVEFLIYPAGNFVLGRGAEVNLGVIIDSVTVQTNDEKIFSEECAVLIDRMGLSRRVTVTVCPNGAIGPEAAAVCPIA
jgi:hypothetical protein